MITIGDILYGGASGAPTRIAGNTTTTQKFLAQTGDGSNAGVPEWVTVAGGGALTEITNQYTATAGQTSFTLTQTRATASVIKMYINGVRIANDAIASTGTTATYRASSNGSYALVAGDIVQLDYAY
jgi:hypothetical protein